MKHGLTKTIQKMQYKSLHEYLDSVLGAISSPTNKQIKEAKSEYWKLWYRYYRKQQRKRRKEFTLGFDTKQLAEIQEQKGHHSTSDFLYQAVEAALSGNGISTMEKESLGTIHQNLMHLIDLLEEQQEDSTNIHAEILERLTALEKQFEITFKDAS